MLTFTQRPEASTDDSAYVDVVKAAAEKHREAAMAQVKARSVFKESNLI
jgi:hypothetical protein